MSRTCWFHDIITITQKIIQKNDNVTDDNKFNLWEIEKISYNIFSIKNLEYLIYFNGVSVEMILSNIIIFVMIFIYGYFIFNWIIFIYFLNVYENTIYLYI